MRRLANGFRGFRSSSTNLAAGSGALGASAIIKAAGTEQSDDKLGLKLEVKAESVAAEAALASSTAGGSAEAAAEASTRQSTGTLSISKEALASTRPASSSSDVPQTPETERREAFTPERKEAFTPATPWDGSCTPLSAAGVGSSFAMGPSRPGTPDDAIVPVKALEPLAEDSNGWSFAERSHYVSSQGLVNIPGEEPVLRFLTDCLSSAPLPAPWFLHRDDAGSVFYANTSTGETSWKHPLEETLLELAGVCRVCISLSHALREPCLANLRSTWEATAKEDFGKWYAIPGPGGREYYCNSESGLTMWEHPAEVLLPAQYMKMRAAERLLDDSYVTDIMMLSAAATNESGGSFYSKGVMGSTASTAAPGFRKALTADGDMDAEDVQIQLAQTVMELEKERANTEKLRSYCAGLSDRMEIAEKNAQEASSLFSKAEQTQLLERTHAEEARAGLDAEVKAKFELTVADLEAERARANQASEKCAELETRHKLAEERAQEADLRFSQSQLRLDEMAVTPSVPQPDPEVHGRLSRAEAELEAERVRTKQARAMCDDLRNSHQKALEDVQEARLAEEQVLSRLASVQLALEELRCATPATPGSNFLDTLEEGRERDEQALPSKEGSVISNDATGGTGDRALSRRVAQEQQDQQNKEVQQQYEEAVRRAEQAIAEHAELAQRHQAALAELKEAEGAKDSAIYRVTELEKEVQHQAAEAAVEISTAAAERQNYERQLQELRGQLERKHEEENTLQVTQDLQLEETKRDLGKQLLDATSSSNAYQEQLEKTALELFHSKLSGEQVAERADRIEAELLVGTVRLEQADAECSTWRSRHEAAVNEVAEAEAARKSLEGTLDHLRHELKDMEAALSAGGDDRIAVLQAALANEQHRLDELLQSQAALDRNKQQLESQLQDAAASTRALQAKLAQTTDELGSAQSAKEDALNCKARAEAESQHALQLAQAAETARLEIEARLKEMESTQKLNALQETQLFEASTTALKAAMAETIAEVGSARTATEEAQRRQAQAEAETHQALQLAREAEMQLAREAEERVLGIESKLRETEATTQLESQLQDAAASTRALQAKLAQTTDELGSAQSAKEDALNCKAQAEDNSQHALQLAQAAETARLEIEARLHEMESTQKLESTQMPFPPSLASPPVVASDEVELEPPNLEQHVANASEEISLESTQMPSPPELPPPPAVTSDEVELEPPKLKEIPLEATQMPFAPKPPPPPDVKPPPPPDVAPDEVVLDPPPVEQAGLSASVELKIPGTTTGLERKRKTAYGRSGDKAARMAAALLAQQIRQIRAESELTRRQIEDAERFAQDLEYGVGRPSRQVMLKLTAAKGSSANFNRKLKSEVSQLRAQLTSCEAQQDMLLDLTTDR